MDQLKQLKADLAEHSAILEEKNQEIELL